MQLNSDSPSADSELDLILAELLEEIEQGTTVTPEAWAQRYPRWSQEIRTFCADLVQFGSLLALQTPSIEATTPFVSQDDTGQVTDASTLPRMSDYELLEELGRGGMGVVYRARRVGTELEVALKAFNAVPLAKHHGLSLLREEVNNACRLKHPHIVTIYHYGEDADRAFYTMERIEGRSLADEMGRFQREIRPGIRLLIKVARAVHHAHQRQIVHRDIKPGNILIDQQGEPHVTDFGLAVRLRLDGEDGVPLTDEVVPAGSLPWMAPEAVRGERELTTAVDVWALGVILYEMITGRRPFTGGPREVRQQIMQGPPPTPREINRAIDRNLSAVCQKCLHPDPSRRYGSADALAEDLNRWLNGRIPAARGRVPAWERFAHWCRARPMLLAGTVVILLYLVGISVTALSALREQERQLIEEVTQANEFAATHVASTVLWQFQRLGEALAKTADDEEFLRLFKNGEKEKLRKYLEQKRQQNNARLRRHLPTEDGSGPMSTLILLDRDSRWVAESPRNPDPKPHQMVFIGREYFQVALQRGDLNGLSRVHVSRVFASANDGMYKLALSIPVKLNKAAGSPIDGVLITTMIADSTFGLDHLHDKRRKVVLLAIKDINDPEKVPTAEMMQAPPRYLILVHRAYPPGAVPVELEQSIPSLHQRTGTSELDLPTAGSPSHRDPNYRDPVAMRYPEYEGRWLAGFARVGNTDLVVGVQQRFDEAVASSQHFLERMLVRATASLLFVLGLFGMIAWILRRQIGRGN